MSKKHPRKIQPAAEEPNESRGYNSPACSLHEIETVPVITSTACVQIKRIYEAPASADGLRVLVDRLWPRGMKKEQAALDIWARELAPSSALRQWFAHDPSRWNEFRKRYRAELQEHGSELNALRERCKQRPVTLLYAAKAPRYNHAVVLREMLCSPHG